MSVDPFEEPLEPAVSPVEVNPFGDAETQDDVILRPLSHEEMIVLQNIVGLKGGGGEVTDICILDEIKPFLVSAHGALTAI